VISNRLTPHWNATSTFDLIAEARRRGHCVDWVDVDSLWLSNDVGLRGRARRVTPGGRSFNGFSDTTGEGPVSLDSFDVLLVRVQPPFTLALYSWLSFLRALEDRVRFINAPRGLLLFPEKLGPLIASIPQPATVVSGDLDPLLTFAVSHHRVVAKPLFEFQGHGVELLVSSDEDLRSRLEVLLRHGVPIVLQEFRPEVAAGDKRVFVVDGEPVAALNRVPRPGHWVASLHAGASGVVTQIGEMEADTANSVGRVLRELGIGYAGLDFIGGALTEVNVLSPTGFVPVMAQGGPCLSAMIFDRYVEGNV
jgi:glutathione synthase